MVKIKQQLVSENVIKQRSYGHGNPVDFIVVHQTGNTNKGANAEMHARLQTNLNPRQASWHISIDDKEAIQSFPDTVRCWATGDGRAAKGGNYNGIQVELCINSDADYKQTITNGADVVAQLLKKHKLTIDKVKQHYDFTPKNCPQQIRAGKDGITWDKFIEMVDSKTGKPQRSVSKPPVNKPTPTKPSNPTTNTSYKGNSIVDYLNHNKINSSFTNRKKLAAQHGIYNYTGTAQENTNLLAKLRANKPVIKSSVTNKGDMKTGSIVTYLNSIKIDLSYKNRAKLASQNGISGYRGSAEQNIKLLGILRKK